MGRARLSAVAPAVYCWATARDVHSSFHDRAQSAGASRPPRLGWTGAHLVTGAAQAVRAPRLPRDRRRQRLSSARQPRRHVLARHGPVRRAAGAQEHPLSSARSARRRGHRHPWRRRGVHRPREAHVRRDQARDAVAAGRYEEAVDCSSGELLAGIHFANAGEAFEDWLSGERLSVAALVMRALQRAGRARAERREPSRGRALGPARVRARAGRRGLAPPGDDAARRGRGHRRRAPAIRGERRGVSPPSSTRRRARRPRRWRPGFATGGGSRCRRPPLAGAARATIA